jgi:hypothetical protein
MTGRVRVGIAAACAALVAAACDGANAFTGDFGTSGSPAGGVGSIAGQVNANGTGLSGVSVVLIDRDSTVTTDGGVFTFSSVPAGTYQIDVRVPVGFSLATGQTSPRNVVVTSSATTGVTFILQGSTTQ